MAEDQPEDKESAKDSEGISFQGTTYEPVRGGAVVVPAYIRARLEAESRDGEEQEDEAGHGTEKAAFARAGSTKKDKEKATDTPGAKAGFGLAGGVNKPSDPFETIRVNTAGTGWRTMRGPDGKMHRVRDDGSSIYVPGNPTPTQMMLVAQLAAEKGWDRVAVFKRGSNKMHPEGTHHLANIMGAGNVETNPASFPRLRSLLPAAEETYRETLLARHRAQTAPQESPSIA